MVYLYVKRKSIHCVGKMPNSFNVTDAGDTLNHCDLKGQVTKEVSDTPTNAI